MNYHRVTFAALFAAATFTSGHVAVAQSEVSRTTAPPETPEQRVQRVDDASKLKVLADYEGKTIMSRDGQKIGKVGDFLLNRSTGAIAGVVVSSGGIAGVGDTLRIVPREYLTNAASGENLTLTIDRAAFEKLSTVAEEDLDEIDVAASGWGAVDVLPRERSSDGAAPASSSGDYANTPSQEPDRDNPDAGKALPGQHVVRASTLRGKDLRVNTADVGDLDELVIDLAQGRAMALVESEDDFAGSEGTFVVPFSKLEITTGSTDDLMTTLTPGDFASAQRFEGGQSLAPTGRPSRESQEQNDANQRERWKTRSR